MQTEKNTEFPINWKKIDDYLSVSNFKSTSSVDGGNLSQIYIKKYGALSSNTKSPITIFLLHDVGQYHGRFAQFIEWIQKENPSVTIVAMDFMGHGLSSGTRGHFDYFDHLVNDFLYLLTHMKKNRDQNEKWIVLGHGMGGLVALDLLNRFQVEIEDQVDGLILSNFILKFPTLFLQLEAQYLKSYLGGTKLFAHSRLKRVMSGREVLSCPDAILKFEQDPLVVHRPTLNSIKEIQKKIKNIYQDSYFLEKPIMILQSEMGEIVHNDGIRYFAKGIKKDLLNEKKYSLMKHDLYNELDRVKVFEDIAEWMKIYEN